MANQKAEFCQQLQNVRAELEHEGGALRRRVESMERERDGEKHNLTETLLLQLLVLKETSLEVGPIVH